MGSAIAGKSCCRRKQSMPASLYFLVMPKEWSWVMRRSDSVPAKATNSTSGLAWLMAPNHGLKSLVSSGAPAHLAPQLLERGLELAAVGLPHRVVRVEDVGVLAHLVDDVLRQPVGLHPRVGLVREVVLVELRGPHELGAGDRVPAVVARDGLEELPADGPAGLGGPA